MRRLAVAAALVGSLLALSCSTDQPQEPQAPTEPSYTTTSDINRLCSTTTDPIQVQICAIFTRPLQFLVATSFYVAIKFEKRVGHTRAAQTLAGALVNITFELYNKKKLVAGTTWEDVTTFTCDLLTFVGSSCGNLADLPAPSQSIHSTVQICGPGGCLVRPEDKHSGVQVPAGACPSICIISVNPIPVSAPRDGPLIFPEGEELDQYPLFRLFTLIIPDFEGEGEPTFNSNALFGICHLSVADGGPYAPPTQEVESRLQLARQAGENVEVFARAVAGFLNCNDLNASNEEFFSQESGRSSHPGWFASAAQRMYRQAVLPIIRRLLPEPAEATVGGCCLGALSNKASPWAAVDPESGFIGPN